MHNLFLELYLLMHCYSKIDNKKYQTTYHLTVHFSNILKEAASTNYGVTLKIISHTFYITCYILVEL
jgi:hypothetical protein